MATVRLYAEQVTDWKSFHSLCRKTFGFPDFYAENMDAWIDCMSDLREDGGLTDIRLALDEVLFIEVSGTESLNKLFPEILNEMLYLLRSSISDTRRLVSSPRYALSFHDNSVMSPKATNIKA